MKVLFIILSTVLTYVSYSQLIPDFSTKIYFEDANGNTDSLELGFDMRSNRNYNPDFGEVDLTDPFGKGLDVRATHNNLLVRNPILSKKIITCSEKLFYDNGPNDFCYAGCSIMMYISADRFPVTLRWNPKDFYINQDCIINSYFTSDFVSEFFDPAPIWFQDTTKRAVCLKENDHYSINLDPEFSSLNYPLEQTYLLIRDYPNHPTDSVFGLKLNFEYDHRISPCHKRAVGLENPVSANGKLITYPNPTLEKVYLSAESANSSWRWKIFDGRGKLLEEQSLYQADPEISLKNYFSGCYFIVFMNLSGEMFYNKIIKL